MTNLVRKDNAAQTHLFTYRYNDARWVLEIPASSADEARERLSRMIYATYDGVLLAKLPATLSPLGVLAVLVRNGCKNIISRFGLGT